MPNLMKMEKDGIVREVVPSAFRNVWAQRGWTAADADAPTDPAELGLREGDKLEDYTARRDQARDEAKAAQEAADEALAAQRKAEDADAAVIASATDTDSTPTAVTAGASGWSSPTP